MNRAAKNSAMEGRADRSRISIRIVVILCIVLLIAGAQRAAPAQTSISEYQVKAAVLFHFVQLVEWPGDAMNASDQSVIFCVFDDEPHRLELQNTLNGKGVGARTLRVRLINQPTDLQGCNIVFLSRDESRRQTATLNSLRSLPVLTVGETDGFFAGGGMIRLRIEEDKIRFDINQAAAENSHLQISSRLLLLATTVTRGAADKER